MKKLMRKILRSDNKIEDLITLGCALVRTLGRFDLNISPKVKYKNQGRITINGRLDFGFLSNQLGMPPNAKGKLRIYENGQMIVNGYIRIARSCLVYVSGTLCVGNRTYINPNSLIYASKNVSIGSGCAIGWNVQILDNDLHNTIHLNHDEITISSAPIAIGDNVWVGANTKIHKGVSIGSGSVIGGSSVVTKDIPPNTLAAGVPARPIRHIQGWQ